MQVTFVFSCGIENTLACLLEERGVTVSGERLSDSCEWAEVNDQSSDLSEEINTSTFVEQEEDRRDHISNSNSLTRLNLDVTTMIAYVSALTNGKCHFVFKEPLLTLQAEWERKKPVKPILDTLFQGVLW